MNFMKKLILTFLLSSVGMAVSAAPVAGQCYEIDGAWYRFVGNDSITHVELVRPAQWTTEQYSGALELPSKVVYEGKEYRVSGLISSALLNSAVTEFTIGEGFDVTDDRNSFINISLRNDASLERINLKSLAHNENFSYGNGMMINVGNHPGCIYVYTRNYGDRTELVIDKFNVYGPDGKKLTPFLAVGEDVKTPLYPDENGVFNLGPNYYYDGKYCIVLPMQAYTVVGLGVEYEGGYCMFRTEPAVNQSGLYSENDDVRYIVTGQDAVVTAPEEGTYSGAVEIPSAIQYGDTELPVTQIGAGAFENSAISSVTVPSNINNIGDNAFSNCESLESADLSSMSNVTFGTGTFAGCTSLTDVALPTALTQIPAATFQGCTALESIVLPATVTSINANSFGGCESLKSMRMPNKDVRLSFPFDEKSGIFEFEVLENTDELIRFTCDVDIYGPDGEKLPLFAYDNAYVYGQERAAYYPENGIFTIHKNTGITTYAAGGDKVSFYYDFAQGDQLPSFSLSDRTTLGFLTITLPKTSGVEAPVVSGEAAPVEYYDLQGIRRSADSLAPGLYIRRQGGKAEKVIVR